MTKYSTSLPQLGNKLFLTDGGLETWLVFHEHAHLPEFASFPLLETETGQRQLSEYAVRHIRIAQAAGTGYILDTPTWRANPDWGAKLGYDASALDRINRKAVAEALALRKVHETPQTPIVVSGVLGPRGDGYAAGEHATPQAACEYHRPQIESFAAAGADMVAAYTMTHSGEASGIALAAREVNLPSVIAFTTETDGRLPSGETLGDAIASVDACTDAAPAHYLVNCAHPDHFSAVLDARAPWAKRLRGIRANASRCSHEELDNAETLDEGDPTELGQLYRALRNRLPQLTVLGGCCGTDHRHIEAISAACT